MRGPHAPLGHEPIRKAVPLLLRHSAPEVLAFHHPLTGIQLVKGTIEAGERDEAATKRELWEESGVVHASLSYLGVSHSIVQGQKWVFYRGSGAGLPERWTRHCADDGGHDFRFFWHPLGAELKGWHPVFEAVIQQVRAWVVG